MSDAAGDQMSSERPVRVPATARRNAFVVGAGAAAGLLYSSVALALFSLLPIQLTYGRRGRREGALAALTAFLVAAAVQALRLLAAGSTGLAAIGAGALPPLVLFAALAAINARFWEGVPATFRVLATSAACALAGLPALVALLRDGGFSEFFAAQLGQALEPLRQQAGVQVGDGGYESSVIAAALDPKALAESALRIFTSCYAGIIALIVGASAWAGNRLAGPGSRGREASPPLSAYRAPYALLWIFLGCWTILLAALLAKVPGTYRAAAWNIAILSSLPYAAQGAGIALSLFSRWKLPRFMRVALIATAVMALFTPTAGVVVAVGLPLLGVTEVWIPYRNPKGVGA